MLYMDGKRVGAVRSFEMESRVTFEYQYDPNTNPAATVQSIVERLKNYATVEAITTLQDEVGNNKQAITTLQDEVGNVYTKNETTEQISNVISNQKNKANGLAALNENGIIPESQLPSYVDDVLEYETKSAFPSKGESGKIYLDKYTNMSYRWGGSEYVSLNSSLALGETDATAYAGSKGKKNAEDIQKIINGATTVAKAETADSATKATKDGDGNVIKDTYASKNYTPKLSDIIGTAQLGSETNPLYYDGEKFVASSLVPREITLENSEWEFIDRVSREGKASEYFYIGEEKTVILDDGKKLSFVILGFNHDVFANDENKKIGITFGMKNLGYEAYNLSPEETSFYNYSEIITSILPSIYQKLPSSLQSVIKETIKANYHVSYDVSISRPKAKTAFTSNTKLFLFSPSEVNAKNPTLNTEYSLMVEDFKETIYDYYKNIDLPIKYTANGAGALSDWYIRAFGEHSVGYTSFWCIDGTGTLMHHNEGFICFGFCV